MAGSRSWWGRLFGAGAAAMVVAGAGWAWGTSLLPDTYSIAAMGYPDYGGGPSSGRHAHHGGGIDITTLVPDPGRPADVTFDLTARAARIELPGVPGFDGYTLNGETPGPELRARVGDLVEVRLRNENVAAGTTLHWHGVDVPNAMDGVAGLTQDAVPPGGVHTYRFVAQAGTYWYHSHQVSHPQVLGGLLGALVVEPIESVPSVLDLTLLVHFYGGVRTINGLPGEQFQPAPPGTTTRVRVINTDAGPMPVWVTGASYRVLAVDGRDLNEPGMIVGQTVVLTAGARVDLEVVVPNGGARIETAGASLVLGETAESRPAPRELVDFLHYGSPAPVAFEPDRPARTFQYRIGRRFGLLDGVPGSWWTINGGLFPDVPMFLVRPGEVVRFRVTNESGEVHPMHLHGHHLLVLSRDGVAATGSPWFVDSLNVEDGETFELAMLADNPGIWMDHCHNLPHAREGLMTHLAYEGYVTPIVVGGRHGNHPE